MKSKLFTVAVTLGLAVAASAHAKPKSPPPPPPPPPPPIVLPGCATSDVQFGSAFAVSCSGFYDKNTIQGAVDAEDILALSSLSPALAGLVDGQAFLTKLDTLAGATDLTFAGYTFYGMTYFGVHLGGGGPYPGVNSSAYYAVDYGLGGGNTLTLNMSASSNIAVFATGSPPPPPPPPSPPPPASPPPPPPPIVLSPPPPPPIDISPPPPPPPIDIAPVPEPSTWLMMITGFGGIGALIRRRRASKLAL